MSGDDLFLPMDHFFFLGLLLAGEWSVEAGADAPAGLMCFLRRAGVAQRLRRGHRPDDFREGVAELADVDQGMQEAREDFLPWPLGDPEGLVKAAVGAQV